MDAVIFVIITPWEVDFYLLFTSGGQCCSSQPVGTFICDIVHDIEAIITLIPPNSLIYDLLPFWQLHFFVT